MFCSYFSVPFRFLTIATIFVYAKLVDEIQKLWPALSRIWLREIHKSKGAQPSQLNVYKMFLARHAIERPSFAYNAGNTFKHFTSRV